MNAPTAWLLVSTLLGVGTQNTDEEPNPTKQIEAILSSAPDCREVAALYNYIPATGKTFVVWYCIGAEIPLP